MNARICSHWAFDRSVPFALSILVRQVRGWYSGVELKMSRRQGGPSRTVAEEGVDLNRYLTNPAAAGQPPDSLAPYQSGYGPSPYRFAQPAVQPCAARY
jgi:hypothetical protein